MSATPYGSRSRPTQRPDRGSAPHGRRASQAEQRQLIPRTQIGAGHPVLLVDDDCASRELLRSQLEQQGFSVAEVVSGEEALAHIAAEAPGLVVMELALPDVDGLQLIRRIRSSEATRRLPILVLTARTAEVDRVLCIELGADDYVTKPFSSRELIARIRAVLRRADGLEMRRPNTVFERGRLRVDVGTYEVYIDERPVSLSLREFDLLRFFVQHPKRVYARAQLIDLVWGSRAQIEPRSVDVHIRRLRRRLERSRMPPRLIATVRGVGYRFDADVLER
jgi:two-component system alkaline phosphatase synthesis response regulator PhoP